MAERSKGTNLAVRTLTGFVLLMIVTGAMMISVYTFLALLLVICLGCQREFYKMVKKTGRHPLVIYSLFAGMVWLTGVFITASGQIERLDTTTFLLFIGSLIFFIPFFAELYRKKNNPIGNIATTLMGFVYVALPLSMLLWMSFGAREAYDPRFPLAYIFIIWANDVGAYLVGITIGRHKLFKRISPKKSWEGFFGGVIFAVLVGFFAGKVINGTVGFWMGLALVASLSGVLGDLVESMFKRSVNIKDSGEVMPGHGGFLDRFDALIMSIPPVFVYFTIFAL